MVSQEKLFLLPSVLRKYVYDFLHSKVLPEIPDVFRRIAENHSRDPSEPLDMDAERVEALLTGCLEQFFFSAEHLMRWRLLEPLVRGEVLDYGCGTGFYTLSLAHRGHRVTCFDTNPLCTDLVRWILSHRRLPGQIRYKITSQHYETALCINVVDHSKSPEIILSRIANALKPSGSLLLYAHFTSDGYHQSSWNVVDRTYRALTTHFRRAPQTDQPGPYFEIWRRRQSVEPIRDDLGRYPILHPEAGLLRDERTAGRFTLTGPRFYLRRLGVDSRVIRVLQLCNGATDFERIVRQLNRENLTRDFVLHVVKELHNHRYLRLSDHPKEPTDEW